MFAKQTLQKITQTRNVFAVAQRQFSAYKATAAEVKKLREMTGSPMGDCVKALNENSGDVEKAKEFLRKKGLAYAEKRADRLATQGLIGLQSDSNTVSMVQFSCETDFVAKTDRFKDGLEAIINTVHAQEGLIHTDDSNQHDDMIKELRLLASLDPDVPQQTIEEGIKFVISKTQENCQLSRVFRAKYDNAQGEILSTYLHNKMSPSVGKIGSLFILKSDNASKNEALTQIANTLAMHTAAMKPSYLAKEDVPQSAKDQAIVEQRDLTISKFKEDMPEKAKEKAIAGAEKTAVSKLMKNEVLLEQELATSDASQTVAQFLKSEGDSLGLKIEIRDWCLFQIK